MNREKLRHSCGGVSQAHSVGSDYILVIAWHEIDDRYGSSCGHHESDDGVKLPLGAASS